MHIPVLLNEVLSYIPEDSKYIIDATLGEGGHSNAILNLNENITIIGFDQDSQLIKRAQANLLTYRDRVIFANHNFSSMEEELTGLNLEKAPDAVVFDLGVSSPHFLELNRGFGFNDTTLDMRMSDSSTLSASDVINSYSQEELTNIFRKYGEEKFSGLVARAIVKERAINPISTAMELSQLCQKVIPQRPDKRHLKTSIHPATRVFQALRIFVNDELYVLEKGINSAVNLVRSGGRVIVISFHSLEDRIVKNIFREKEKQCICPPEFPVCKCSHKAEIKILTRKPIVPTKEEIEKNPKSRSAKLRVCEKL